MQRFIRSWWLWVIYIVIGVFVAVDKNYTDFHFPWKPIISLVLAVLLWPLTLLGINLHVH
jgi:hypothetical protein